jgi:hypothetical protein
MAYSLFHPAHIIRNMIWIYFSNGATHVLFSPLDFISKHTALIPKPRHHLVRYHGAFARGCHQPNAKIRNQIDPATKLQAKQQKVNQLSHKPASTEDLPSPDSPVAAMHPACLFLSVTTRFERTL